MTRSHGASQVDTPDGADATQQGQGSRPGRRAALMALGLTGVVAYVVDLVTKILAVAHLDPLNPPEYLGGLLRLALIRNPGAAFSIGTSLTVVLSLLAIAALVFCALWLAPRARGAGQGFVLGLAMAGIAGNLTDRLFRAPGPLRGHVVDFFSVPHFAIFNVADICLTSAAGLVIVWSIAEVVRERRAGASAPEENATTDGDPCQED